MQPARDLRSAVFVFPWPPSKNRLHLPLSFIPTPEYRKFRDEVARIVRETGHEALTAPAVKVAIDCYPPNNRGDIANCEVATLDAMQRAGVFDNDRAVKRLTVEHIETRHDQDGSVRVTITELSR